MDISVLKHASADLHPTPQQSQNAGLGQGKEKSPRGVILQKMLGSMWCRSSHPQANKICCGSGGVQFLVTSPTKNGGQQVVSESSSPVLQNNAGQQAFTPSPCVQDALNSDETSLRSLRNRSESQIPNSSQTHIPSHLPKQSIVTSQILIPHHRSDQLSSSCHNGPLFVGSVENESSLPPLNLCPTKSLSPLPQEQVCFNLKKHCSEPELLNVPHVLRPGYKSEEDSCVAVSEDIHAEAGVYNT